MLTLPLEEEKKAIAPLLGKLYVSPASTEDKLRSLYADVSEAVDAQLLADATGRNALYKIHVALGKIVNTLDQPPPMDGWARRSVSRAASIATSVATHAGPAAIDEEEDDGDRTVVVDRTVVIKEEEEDEDDVDTPETTVVHREEDEEEGDSLVDDLLADGET